MTSAKGALVVRSRKVTGCGRGFFWEKPGYNEERAWPGFKTLASVTARWKALLINPVPIYELSL